MRGNSSNQKRMRDIDHLHEVAAFIRGCRSNEAAFEQVCVALVKETVAQASDNSYKSNLPEVKEKAAEEYKKAKEVSGTAGPEFKKFVTGFEKAVLQAANE